MKTGWKKSYKFVAVTLAVILFAQVVVFSMDSVLWFSQSNAENAAANQTEEARIAAEISNMTGVSVDRILQLRKAGLSWNEITEQLKNGDSSIQLEGQKKRDSMLLEAGLSEETIQQMLAEGYDEDEITEAKLIAERVAFQLEELVQISPVIQPDPASMLLDHTGKNKEEELAPFQGVADRFNVGDAVRWMLVLSDDLGTMEASLDEYLTSLQYDLDLNELINNKENYMDVKESRKLEKPLEVQVSIGEIERRLLLKIQSENEKQQADESLEINNDAVTDGNESDGIEIPLPDVPNVKSEDLKPDNPADAVMKEIEVLNPNNKQF